MEFWTFRWLQHSFPISNLRGILAKGYDSRIYWVTLNLEMQALGVLRYDVLVAMCVFRLSVDENYKIIYKIFDQGFI